MSDFKINQEIVEKVRNELIHLTVNEGACLMDAPELKEILTRCIPKGRRFCFNVMIGISQIMEANNESRA